MLNSKQVDVLNYPQKYHDDYLEFRLKNDKTSFAIKKYCTKKDFDYVFPRQYETVKEISNQIKNILTTPVEEKKWKWYIRGLFPSALFNIVLLILQFFVEEDKSNLIGRRLYLLIGLFLTMMVLSFFH